MRHQLLKRKILTNPNTGRLGTHPRPESSIHRTSENITSTKPRLTSSIRSPQPFQTHLSVKSKSQPHVQMPPPSPSNPPPKPKKSVTLTHKDQPAPKHVSYTKHVAKSISSEIAEVPRSHIPTQEEIETIKKLKAFKPVAIGTSLFILGLVVSAILAIIFNLI